ncbi:MAG TPA: hypothetical protein VEO00_13105 [Actinomycetota bacterium]|nr:hypothetical protein [Actinomycetota bacterium]
MTTIRTTCPSCGEVDMTPERIVLAIRPEGSAYRFDCPLCEEQVEKRADRKVVALLLSAGVVLEEANGLPPAFTPADALELRSLLDDQGFVDRLTGQR